FEYQFIVIKELIFKLSANDWKPIMLKNGIENTNTDIGMIIIPSKNVTIIKFNKYSLFTFFIINLIPFMYIIFNNNKF
ncbi:TPA: hypothetical protein ACH98T_002321, partial [Staphylococcus aureus]